MLPIYDRGIYAESGLRARLRMHKEQLGYQYREFRRHPRMVEWVLVGIICLLLFLIGSIVWLYQTELQNNTEIIYDGIKYYTTPRGVVKFSLRDACILVGCIFIVVGYVYYVTNGEVAKYEKRLA